LGLAVGNFDGALLTWGIIGFTMTSGEQKKILLAVNQSHPELIQQAFGAKSGELLKLMTGTREFQKQGRMNIRYRMGRSQSLGGRGSRALDSSRSATAAGEAGAERLHDSGHQGRYRIGSRE